MPQNLAQYAIHERRLALDTLSIKVIATPERIEVTGVISIDITIAQTSGCLPFHAYSYSEQDKVYERCSLELKSLIFN